MSGLSGVEKDAIAAYAAELEALTFNSKPIISSLTMIAEELLPYARSVVAVIEKKINKASPDKKLPLIYLLDSICKNLAGAYSEEVARKLPSIMASAYIACTPKVRNALDFLVTTWNGVFPPSVVREVVREMKLAAKEAAQSSAVADRQSRTQPKSAHATAKAAQATREVKAAREVKTVPEVKAPGYESPEESWELEVPETRKRGREEEAPPAQENAATRALVVELQGLMLQVQLRVQSQAAPDAHFIAAVARGVALCQALLAQTVPGSAEHTLMSSNLRDFLYVQQQVMAQEQQRQEQQRQQQLQIQQQQLQQQREEQLRQQQLRQQQLQQQQLQQQQLQQQQQQQLLLQQQQQAALAAHSAPSVAASAPAGVDASSLFAQLAAAGMLPAAPAARPPPPPPRTHARSSQDAAAPKASIAPAAAPSAPRQHGPERHGHAAAHGHTRQSAHKPNEPSSEGGVVPAAVRRLYDARRLQCHTCAQRFADGQQGLLRQHLEWHMKRKKRSSGKGAMPLSRRWLLSADAWASHPPEDADLDDAPLPSAFDEAEAVADPARAADDADAADDLPVLPFPPPPFFAHAS